MKILEFIKNYWTQILFIITIITGYIKLFIANREATKCSLRNDILKEIKDYKKI